MEIAIYNNLFRNLDLIALAWFIFLWTGFHYYADYSHKNVKSLVGTAQRHYLNWMRHMITRTDRLIDSRTLEALLTNVRFFASTAILILAGLVTMLGYGEKGMTMFASLPFAMKYQGMVMWELKTIVLIIIFIYCFFKCTWAIRQYGYACMLISAAPHNFTDPMAAKYAENCAQLIGNAARHFNLNIRAYYFGLAVLSWFVHPVLFMVCSTWVTVVLYRREFRSKVLEYLSTINV